jgi:hypothetical protein
MATLEETIRKVLKKRRKGIELSLITKDVIESGYRTKACDFPYTVYRKVREMERNNKVKKVARNWWPVAYTLVR